MDVASASTGDRDPDAPSEAVLADVVARLRRAMRRAARAAHPGNALSVAQLELLSCVAENPGARPSQIARRLRLAPTSVTTLVNGLQSQQMISRSANTADRRAVSLRLTEAGAAAVASWQSTNADILQVALADLDPGWRHLLTSALPALKELIRAIDASTDAARS